MVAVVGNTFFLTQIKNAGVQCAYESEGVSTFFHPFLCPEKLTFMTSVHHINQASLSSGFQLVDLQSPGRRLEGKLREKGQGIFFPGSLPVVCHSHYFRDG